jgi:hypothetical protein
MGSRTPDLLIANETLYQLSYDPIPNPRPLLCRTSPAQQVVLGTCVLRTNGPEGGSALPVKSCGVDPIEKEFLSPNDRRV